MLQFLWLGNPENRRCQFFLDAAKQEGFPPPIVLSYETILTDPINWKSLLSTIDIVRLESPGENAAVAQGLLQWGAQHPALKTPLSTTVPLPKGSLAGLRQQHLGFLLVLEQVEKALAAFPKIQLVNSLDYIRLCFDKQQCHAHFAEQNIAVPSALYQIQNYEELRSKMAQKGWNRVFVKPLHGSSASGVVAFRRQGQRLQAITSVEMQQQNGQVKLFNSLRLQKYTQEKDIALLLDHLAQEEILVEQWIPKASLGEAVFDLRMVVVGGKCQHVVVRQSQSPLTNLHLGNQRGSLALLQEKMGTKKWQAIQQLVEQAAAVLPSHQYACLDVLVQADFKQSYILEANAFGDLLPRVLYQEKNTYAAVLQHLKQWHYV
ncbi:MAG: STM4014 family protein [Aureispira sp.]